jgi:hypothetical protein
MTRQRRHGAARFLIEDSSSLEVLAVSIVRIGLAETKKFAEGYEAIFGNKKKKDDDKPAKAKKKPAKAKKKKK